MLPRLLIPKSESVIRQPGPLERLRANLRRSWGRHAKTWMSGQFIFVWALAQSLPLDVLDRLPILKSLCAPIVAAMPTVSSFIARSDFPQVTEVILCLGWVLAPVNLIYGLLLPEHIFTTKPKTISGEILGVKSPEAGVTGYLISGVIMFLLVPALFWLHFSVPLFNPEYNGNDEVFGSYTHRWVFGFFGQLISAGFGYLAAFWVVITARFGGLLYEIFAAWKEFPTRSE